MASQPKLLLTRRWPAPVEAEMRLRYDVTVDPDDRPLTEAQLREAMTLFDVLCPTVCDRIDASVLSVSNPRVTLVASYGAGVDHIDLKAAAAARLMVSNTPDVTTDATADTAILLMMMASRRASEGERELRAGRWSGWHPTHLVGQSLSGKTLGLVGLGRIGQATATRAARAFGMKILYHSRTRRPAEIEAETGARYVASLDALAAEADVLSLHCHGGPATRHLVNRRLLQLMKPSAILINTARGSIVDEAALADALAAGTIWAAGLDVFEREPNIPHALLRLPNAVLLPHLGSAVEQTRVAMGMRVVANIDSFFAGKELPDRVS
ncbi:2-hydroxyacid dehydrogenase [Sphingomonas sp. SRS2]|uniref:2-hydroxyacid dehydrogenase n=1 Tax=Sphingomonas sp. SRS2 TaxID=133190 RepID=UPI000618484A|nr:D-glycerate dehydrogenase [Sphingomonas sp. SRS2]KKC26786.1 2-hydroxyacid dehydrogenase [Sphingomonas sp. SRS2]